MFEKLNQVFKSLKGKVEIPEKIYYIEHVLNGCSTYHQTTRKETVELFQKMHTINAISENIKIEEAKPQINQLSIVIFEGKPHFIGTQQDCIDYMRNALGFGYFNMPYDCIKKLAGVEQPTGQY